MKKILLTSICSLLSFGAFADNMPAMPTDGQGAHMPRGGMNMMAQLTDEQKSCIEAYGCKMPEMPKFDESAKPAPGERPSGERPEKGTKPEMTDEQKESMECMHKAMEACGIEMPKPEHGERPSGERPTGTRGSN